MNLGSIQLNVTPEVLFQKADTVERQIRSMRHDLSVMADVAAKMGTYWIGDASNAHLRKYRHAEHEIDEIMKRFSDTPIRLKEIAGTYLQIEQVAEEVASALPGDVLL